MAKREGQKMVTTWQAEAVAAAMAGLAERNGRTVAEEWGHAAERHLSQPPTVRVVVEAEPLAHAEATAKPETRGRPRKEKKA